jgi:tRNA/tmRNA/rRNA uracil-C5-methylase (TrmA/RlmC/RlmD family)
LIHQTFELTLDEMVHGGNTLGRHAGRAIFVPYTIPGERITARIVDDHSRYAFAEGVTLLDATFNTSTTPPSRVLNATW